MNVYVKNVKNMYNYSYFDYHIMLEDYFNIWKYHV
jgi:hypothetical protein